jgi:predicted MPP superfamily phosphohydrolase
MTQPDADEARPSTTGTRVRVLRKGRWLQLRHNHDYERIGLDLFIPRLHPTLAGLRIVHLSDLHLTSRWLRGFDEFHQHLNDSPADLILLSGDFVEHKFDHRPALPTLRRFLAGLRSRLGVFGILGNHDGDLLPARIGDFPVTLINGRSAVLSDGAARIELLGFPGVGREDVPAFDHRAFEVEPRPPDGSARLALTHFPDTVTHVARLRPHLVLCGHTHGGQICLPGRRPLITHDSLPPEQSAGLHAIDGTQLYVSRGFGFSTLPLRLFSPAEVLEIVLHRA